MPKKAQTQSDKDKDKTPSQWRTTRQLWAWAASAEIDLERKGQKVTFAAIWKLIAKHAPDEQQQLPEIPPDVKEALTHPGYRQLVEIKKSMLVIPALKDLGVLRELTAQGAYLAMTSALEQLVANPESIPVAEKRQLARTFMDMNMRIGKPADEKPETGTGSIADVAAEEQEQRDKALALVPAPYRERMAQVYDEERAKALRTRSALHIVQMNEKESHAKTG
jgi:hypothetical protein